MVAVNVSRPDERLIRGTLEALPFLVTAISEEDPTLLLIGEALAPRGQGRFVSVEEVGSGALAPR
jgi:uroporphyrin-III C-methyltransferase